MSIDKLHDRIRKLKAPIVVDFIISQEQIPPSILEEEGGLCLAYNHFARDLLTGLRGIVPAVRFHFNAFALLGSEGLDTLAKLLTFSKELGFYVLLDGVESLSDQDAQYAAEHFFSGALDFDGLIISSYIGADGIRPYIQQIKRCEKSLFVVLRTANKTAAELQDLLTGTRLMHIAAADMVNRLGESLPGRCGYWQIAGICAANAPDSLRTLRTKYKSLFLLVDGLDYSNANTKNCSYAFDRFGYGAIISVGSSITAAWRSEGGCPEEFVANAVAQVERIRKNLFRYISIL